jgi:hypothetical protein
MTNETKRTLKKKVIWPIKQYTLFILAVLAKSLIVFSSYIKKVVLIRAPAEIVTG